MSFIQSLKKSFVNAIRYMSDTFEENSEGRLFVVGDQIQDFTDVEIVHSGVDTVRQLFYGEIKLDFYNELDKKIKEGDNLIKLSGSDFSHQWHIGKLPKSSHYRIKLQNNELGVVVLLGHTDSKIDKPGTHLKIEFSPHFIDAFKVKGLMNFMTGKAFEGQGIVGLFLSDYLYNGVAVHLAIDYQGDSAVLPQNFL